MKNFKVKSARLKIQKSKKSFRFLQFCLLLAACCLLHFYLSANHAYGSVDACGTDCMKCHSLTENDVQGILKKINNPDAKILKIQMSPIRGLWEVSIDNNGQRGLFYIDFAKKHLIGGPIIAVDLGADKTKERLAELNKDRRVDLSRIPLQGSLVLGNKKAAKKIIVFTDPDCPFCGKYHEEIKKVVEQRKDVAFYIKLFPLPMHPDAYWKSKTIVCTKSLKLLDDNFEKKPIPKPACETDEIDKNIKLAKSLGITGTPTSIMPDGSVQVGFFNADKLLQIIDSVKKKGAEK